MEEITTIELKKLLDDNPLLNLIDVRSREEFELGHVKGAQLIELEELTHNASSLDKQATYYFICRSGGRSGMATKLLTQLDYTCVNVSGGMLSWQENGFDVE